MALELHADAQKNFNEKAEALLLELATHQNPFSEAPKGPLNPDIHVAAEFTDEDIIDVIEIGMVDMSGNESGKLFRHEDRYIGLFDEKYKNLVRLAESMQKTKTIRNAVSVKTLIGLIFSWTKARYLNVSATAMVEFVLCECERLIQEIEIWVPIAWLHVQSNIQLGKITFKAITREMLTRWFSQATPARTTDEEVAFKQFMERERGDLQGFAAATIKLSAEPDRAAEIALEEAERAVSLLRFFSPANFSPLKVSYSTLMGREYVETSRHLVVRDGLIIGEERGVVDNSNPRWAISNADIAEINSNGLSILNGWLCKDRNSDFEKALLDCLILYSKNSLAKNATDKLIYLLVSLESILLKDSNEVIQSNLGERLAFSIGANARERKSIITNTKQIYDLRSSFIHHGNYIEIDDLTIVQEFMFNSWRFLHWLITAVDKGLTKESFFEMLETRKLS